MRPLGLSPFPRSAWVLLLVLLVGPSGPAQAGDPGPPPGPYAVAASNLDLDLSRVEAGRELAEYLAGARDEAGPLYLDRLLAQPAAALAWSLAVPAGPDRYGEAAGLAWPMAALLLHPTPADNPDPDYAWPEPGPALPRMRPAGGPARLLPGPWPLLIYSPGQGLYPGQMGELLSLIRLASQGFIVAALFHGDGRVDDDQASGRPVQLALRTLSVRSLLDRLEADPEYGPAIAWDRVAGVGASYGGATCLALSGALVYDPAGGGLARLDFEPRLKAAAGLVGFAGTYGLPLFGPAAEGGQGLERPQMIVCGGLDLVAPCLFSRALLSASTQPGYLVTVAGQSHLFQTDALAEANAWILTFLQAWLRDDPQAHQALVQNGSIPGGPADWLEVFNPPAWDLPGPGRRP